MFNIDWQETILKGIFNLGLDKQWKTLFNRIEKVTSIYDFWNFMENDLIEG